MTPSAWTSVAVVTLDPRTCSGLAYSGVITRVSAVATAGSGDGVSGLGVRILAMPKSSSLGVPWR
jgi:hypothetical protein